MLILLLLMGALSQSTYYITVDDALSDLLKIQPKGYQPWHPSLNVRLRSQEQDPTFYSFVQQQIKIKNRGKNLQLVQLQGPEFFENLVCKCSFTPAEAVEEEEGGDEAEAGACEAGGGDEEPEGGEEPEGEGGEEVEFIVKKTKAHGKDFSFLQVGTQSNLNQYTQPDQMSQYDQRLLAQEQLIRQFMEKQNQLTQQIAMMQQQQGVFVPSLLPQVLDPNYLNPQQQAQMLYMLQQQQLQQQMLQQQMMNPLSFQSSPTIVKNDGLQPQYQQPIVYPQTFQQPVLTPQQQLLLQQQLQQNAQLNLQIPQLNQQQPQQQYNQQLLLNQQQIPLQQPQIPLQQAQNIQQQNIQQIPQQQSQIPQNIQQIPQTVQQIPQNIQQVPQQLQNQQIPQQQFQQFVQPNPQIQQPQYVQQQPQFVYPQQQQQQFQQIPQQQIPSNQAGFLQPQQQTQVDQQMYAQQMTQPLMQPQFLQKQPQLIGG